jgi:hypothetical protein
VATFLFWQKPAFRYPLPKAARTAVLVPWFRSTDAARVFAAGWSEEAVKFAPQAIAGSREQLLALAENKSLRLTHAMIGLARPGEVLLTTAERDLLWRRFGVPIFEQIIGESGEVLAAECQAHDGLHVEGSHEWTRYKIEQAPCACGKSTPRLIALERATFAAAS